MSPKFGPAKQWKQIHCRGSSLESPTVDSATVQVIGVDTAGNQTPLYNLNLGTQDYDISSVNAAQYPYIQLKLITTDTLPAEILEIELHAGSGRRLGPKYLFVW